MSEQDEGKRFNPIFDKFVTLDQPEDQQLAGFVAYALYKRQKREWAEALWNTEKRRPTQADLDAFVRTCTPSYLASLSETAENALAKYVSAYTSGPRV